MLTSMGVPKGHRNAALYLLVYHQGRWDPEIVRARRMLSFWTKLLMEVPIPLEYWQGCRPGGRSRPIQLFRNFLRHYDIVADTPTQWVIQGRSFQVLDQHGLQAAALGSVQRVLWQRATKGHTLFQGLDGGRDPEASLGPRAPCANAALAAFRDILLCGGVYTPQLAHFRWGKQHHCPVCGTANADWPHFVDACPHLPRGPALLPDTPGCLKYTGNVPTEYNPPPHSLEMETSIRWDPQDLVSDEVAIVATDGGCRSTAGGPRAGWGISTDHGIAAHGAVPGPAQTAQRGEVTALFEAVQRLHTRMHVVIDSKYVCHTLQRALQGRTPVCLHHGDLWSRIFSQIHKIVEVTWVKAHILWDEAQPRGIQHTHTHTLVSQPRGGCMRH